MQRFVVATLAATSLMGLTAVASAADMPTPAPVYTKAPVVAPTYNWTGFYLGGTVGGAWGDFDAASSTSFCTGAGCYFIPANVTNYNNIGASQRLKSSSFTGGAEAGYNWQMGHLVLGVEADIEALKLRGQTASSTAAGGFTQNYNASVSDNWIFTARPRIGFAQDNWLIYGTGGVAVTQLNGNFGYADNLFGPFQQSQSGAISSTKTGFAAGAGVEAGLSKNWTVKAEYLYVDFGSVSTTSNNLTSTFFTPAFVFSGQTFTHTMDLKANIARLGLNYKF